MRNSHFKDVQGCSTRHSYMTTRATPISRRLSQAPHPLRQIWLISHNPEDNSRVYIRTCTIRLNWYSNRLHELKTKSGIERNLRHPENTLFTTWTSFHSSWDQKNIYKTSDTSGRSITHSTHGSAESLHSHKGLSGDFITQAKRALCQGQGSLSPGIGECLPPCRGKGKQKKMERKQY